MRLDEVRAYAAQSEAGQRYLNRFWLTATSGSSGQPGFFLFDDAEWVSVLASFARSQEWSGVQINLARRQRMATVASTSPWHMSSQVSATAKSWWRPSLRLPASQPLSKIVEQLNDWPPELLITYASMAGILAGEQLAGRLEIHPSVVYAASEVLTAQARQLVRQAWGDEPFNQYAATETASIAAEHRACRHMHFFEDMVIAEVVDEQYRPVPPGEYGARVLVTTLYSRTQPLIRYQLDDSVRVSAGSDGVWLAVRHIGRRPGTHRGRAAPAVGDRREGGNTAPGVQPCHGHRAGFGMAGGPAGGRPACGAAGRRTG